MELALVMTIFFTALSRAHVYMYVWVASGQVSRTLKLVEQTVDQRLRKITDITAN